MTVTGRSTIAGTPTVGVHGTFRAVNPATGRPIEPAFGFVGPAEIEQATRAAEDAFDDYRGRSPDERAAFLERIAEALDGQEGDIVARAAEETGLAPARLTSEHARTVGQLRLFAETVRSGDDFEARVDSPQPHRRPLPRPDLRLVHIPLGPVVVFGASNFPLAFSTAGGDTVAALAAGCPVIVKAHNAHPGTAELVGQAIADAVADGGLPPGVFAQLFGSGTEIGQWLAADPRVKAIAFTGSRAGGLALTAAAAARPEPIPVYAEMSSINPVVILAGALDDPAGLAAGYVGSLTLGAGQFCTNPGVVFVPESDAGDAFVEAAAVLVRARTGEPMLTEQIARARMQAGARLSAVPRVTPVAAGTAGDGPFAPAPTLVSTSATEYVARPELQHEVFGAASLMVRYNDLGSLRSVLARMEGQLTATIHHGPTDIEAVGDLLPVLERKVGRIIFGGWPTGVEVTHAMMHGGPFPATADGGRTTSVGTLAIRRFLRPVCYQDAPEVLLPTPLREDNPWQLPRRVDGTLRPSPVR